MSCSLSLEILQVWQMTRLWVCWETALYRWIKIKNFRFCEVGDRQTENDSRALKTSGMILCEGKEGGEEAQQIVETFACIGLASGIDFSHEHRSNFKP